MQACGLILIKDFAEMLKHMFIWTRDFEKKRDEYEKYLLNYQYKLIWIHSVRELNKKRLQENLQEKYNAGQRSL